MDRHMEILAERLSLLRQERNLTLVEVSQGAGVGISTLSQYENCQREIRTSI